MTVLKKSLCILLTVTLLISSTALLSSAEGGNSEYIRVALKPEMMAQYGVTLNGITQAISAADLTELIQKLMK